MINSVLVANRGEIALRVFRTCRALGIETVAIFTDADAAAPHVSEADRAVWVESYLDGNAVVAAAQQAGAEAIHPGYGFLSENAGFAHAVGDVGLIWVGPSPEVIQRMGRKDAAREIAVDAGVPVVPTGAATGPAAGMEFPVLVKAAAGGGGKGMRIVRAPADLDDAVASAKREAASAFGDDTILVEKYVERGRHIEVQVLGDAEGNVIHLLTRECSVQRRHQKVIEEAPAPRLGEELRERIHAAAVALATGVGYTNAGTVEFLLDDTTGEFYFLEMNTRLQVEHPVTEAVTGLDLVELQLRVAGGEEIPLSQDDVTPRGHAIEARVYAEDPYAGFLPQAGRASVVRWPSVSRLAGAAVGRWRSPAASRRTSTSVRVDHALEPGQVVGTAYDPMLGKVVAHAPDREAAREALVAALDDTVILGLTTNTGFLRELAAGDAFRDAAIDTAWLDRFEPAPPDQAPARELAAWAWQLKYGEQTGAFRSDGFRLGGAAAAVVITLDQPVTLRGAPPRVPPALVTGHRVELARHGQRFAFERPDPAADHGPAAGDGSVSSPMPGTVLDVRVSEGQQVVEGDVLGVVEAMKMELALKAPFAGSVTSVTAAVGQQVALGAALFVVEPAGDTL